MISTCSPSVPPWSSRHHQRARSPQVRVRTSARLASDTTLPHTQDDLVMVCVDSKWWHRQGQTTHTAHNSLCVLLDIHKSPFVLWRETYKKCALNWAWRRAAPARQVPSSSCALPNLRGSCSTPSSQALLTKPLASRVWSAARSNKPLVPKGGVRRSDASRASQIKSEPQFFALSRVTAGNHQSPWHAVPAARLQPRHGSMSTKPRTVKQLLQPLVPCCDGHHASTFSP